MKDEYNLPAVPVKIVTGPLSNEEREDLIRVARIRREVEAKVDQERSTAELQRTKQLADAHSAMAQALRDNDPARVLSAVAALKRAAQDRGTKRERLAARRYDPSKASKEPRVIFWLNGIPVATEGNLLELSAAEGAGKTSFTTGLIAAALQPAEASCDTLGWRAANRGGAIVHLDTEQSPQHHDQLCERVRRRAQLPALPDTFFSYRLVGSSPEEVRESIDTACEVAEETVGSIYAVVIDGIGDATSDVNEPRECNALVAHLNDLAIRYRCSIIVILHRNPGASDGKTRGHLGSQLARKAESRLTIDVEKDEVTSAVYGRKMRGKRLPKSMAVRFAWDEDSQLHRTATSTPPAPKTPKPDRLDAILAALRAVGRPLTAAALVDQFRQHGTPPSIAQLNRDLKRGVTRGQIVAHECYPRTYEPKAK